ncbi:cell adhesion molecule-related/down-regulated by oncogenes [Spea bombifrons]|uniref:cell adhesion molecule-related/down-regulated by oncogenes n=1 Tax=Spea bombifrons TaxID=233779 RepID=UPI00234A46D7|nr:cell adhesion molecule-related/down-regulated by oncogenes [Spea bombifrons]XP_053308311.1 cell adhesion molecule-related/down-regulated by oncogenes [Spea bombifrons]
MHPDPGRRHLVLGLWLVTLSICSGSDGLPHFTSEPLSVIQKVGGTVTLSCSADPPWSQIAWMFNGKVLETRHAQVAEIHSGFLNISSLGLSQAGLYQCVARVPGAAIVSRPAKVSVAYLGEFDAVVPSGVSAEEGGSAFVGCKVPRSAPGARIRYKVRGQWLEESTGKYLILPSGSLHILNASLEDRGAYRCAAYNPVSHELRVSPVAEKLSINRSSVHVSKILNVGASQTLSVLIHEPLTLECVVGGAKLPEVAWLKDGQNAITDGKRKLFHTHLVMESVERSDAGVYSCSLMDHSVNYTVIVLEPPSVTRSPVDQAAPVGGSVRFTCESRGEPAPNITWLHNGAVVYPSPRFHVSGNKLRISNINTADSGIYQCVADNGVGVALSAARLAIQSVSEHIPVIVSPPSNVSSVNGDLVTLTCNATGVQTPSIRWYNRHGAINSHPSQVLHPKSRRAQQRAEAASAPDPVHLIVSQAGSSSLYIQGITEQHAGKYTCEASNDFGSSRAEAFVTVAPYETSIDMADADAARIEEDGKRSRAGSSLPSEQQTAPSATEKPITGASVPEAPIILSPPLATKPDVYFLLWRSGKDGGSPINAYFVRYRKLDDDGNMVGNWNSIRVPASESEFPLTELEPSSLYEVLMVARNAAGEGQPAMLTFRTSKERASSSKNTQSPSAPGGPKQPVLHERSNTNFGLVAHDSGAPEAPDRPTISTASETSVYVTWIPRANGGSPITSFKVEYKRAKMNWVTAADNIPPSKLSVEISNLEPGAVYKFRVIAINHYGESQRSAVSRPYQVAEYSSRVSNPLIMGPHIDHTEAMTDTQILLKWTYTPASNNNTPIQGFYIYYRPTDSDNDHDYKRDEVPGTKQRHLIRDLLPETSYDIKMQCYNERGASDFSNVMICETRAKRNPGASEYPVLDLSTPSTLDRGGGGSGGSGSSSASSLARSGDMLFVIVGCVLGGMVLILMAFIAICLLKHRQQSLMQKFEPPGYIYQGTALNGQIIEYTAGSHTNNRSHGGFMGNGSLGCPHMHHKVHAGLNGMMNGDLYPGCPSSMKETFVDLPRHPNIGGGLYAAIPQADPSECINCRNCCNNNRCFSNEGVTTVPAVATFQSVSHIGDHKHPISMKLDGSGGLEGQSNEESSPHSPCLKCEEEDSKRLSQNGADGDLSPASSPATCRLQAA